MNNKWPSGVYCIPDEYFVRGTVPMTKREVRILTIAQACLQPAQILWDIGAGTGSLTVEAARLTGHVYAVEKQPQGQTLIAENVRNFGLLNVTVIPGTAPAALHHLPDPDRILVGGSGGSMREILQVCGDRLLPGGRIVINVFAPQNLAWALDILQKPPFTNAEGFFVQISRLEKLGSEDIFRAQNGIWVVSAQKEATG